MIERTAEEKARVQFDRWWDEFPISNADDLLIRYIDDEDIAKHTQQSPPSGTHRGIRMINNKYKVNAKAFEATCIIIMAGLFGVFCGLVWLAVEWITDWIG